jgi:hypothetical protein
MTPIEQARARNRKWYWKNPAAVRAKKNANASKWQKLNPERRRAIYRRWYYRHREEILANKNAVRREKYKLLTPEEKHRKALLNKEWRSRNARYIQQQRLVKYRLTIEQFDAILERQGGVCAICGSANPGPKNWHVDHNHKTGKVRGLLCHHCNCGIGHFKDAPRLLAKAAEYISKDTSTCQ